MKKKSLLESNVGKAFFCGLKHVAIKNNPHHIPRIRLSLRSFTGLAIAKAKSDLALADSANRIPLSATDTLKKEIIQIRSPSKFADINVNRGNIIDKYNRNARRNY